MKFPRASGILLHPPSLPGPYGIGDLGPAASGFIDVLAEAGQTYWQILPLGPTGFGDSPYQCFSAFGGNTLMISPDLLLEGGLLTREFINGRPDFSDDKVDFGAVYEWNSQMLEKAYENFHQATDVELRTKFEKFSQENAWWLDDYALYRSVKGSQAEKPWYEWPTKLKLRNREALADAGEELNDQIQAQKFWQ